MSTLSAQRPEPTRGGSSVRYFFSVASLVLVLSYADYGFQFLYQMTLGRLLSVEDYGVYSALLSLNLVFSLFSVSFPLLVLRTMSRVVAEDPTQFWPCFRESMRRLTKPLIVFAAVVFALSQSCKDFFHLQSAWPIWLVTATCILSSYQYTLVSMLQALQFYRYSAALTLVFTLMRFTLGAGLIYFFRAQYWGVYLGLLVANAVEIVLIFSLLKRKAPRPLSVVGREFKFDGWQSAILISLSMATLIGLDTSLARHFLEPAQAGFYAAASQVAKIVMVVGNPFLALIIPEVTRARSSAGSRISLRGIVLLGLGVTLSAWICVSLLPRFLMGFMLGAKFVDGAALVPPLAVATLCAAVVALLNNYFFALNQSRYFYILFGTSLLSLGVIIWRFHATALQLAFGIMGGSMVAAAIALTIFGLSRRTYVK